MITLICFILGIVGGIFLPNIFVATGFIGTIYINLLKIMIVPILFTSISLSLAKGKNSGKITLKTVLLFILMFSISFAINSAFVQIIKPGVGFNFTKIDWGGTLASTSLSEFFLTLVPTNIITAMSNNSILPVIVFAAIFGLAIKYAEFNKNSEVGVLGSVKICNVILTGLEELNAIFNKMLSWIMKLTPIGVFFLIGNSIATFGIDIIKSVLIYILMAWIGCFIVYFLVMIVPVWITGINPITYIKKVAKIWAITLSTCSSAATLPTTIKVCNEEFGVPDEITNITVPLGCTIHMCGGAVSFSLLALFNMQMFGITLTPQLFLLMLFVALIINMGAPGIPGGGIVIGASYLSILGLPIDFIGIYAGIYRILDMIYTTMNVVGDISANILIEKTEREDKA